MSNTYGDATDVMSIIHFPQNTVKYTKCTFTSNLVAAQLPLLSTATS